MADSSSSSELISKGKKVRLLRISHGGVYNSDGLRRGDEGVVVDITNLPKSLGGNRQIWIKWETNSTVALIEGEDSFCLLD